MRRWRDRTTIARPGNGQKIYELQAWGPGGFVKSLRSLTVRPGNAPPTAQPQPPVIGSFSANPPQLDATNTCVVLQWQVSGQGIAAIWLSRNGQQIAGRTCNPVTRTACRPTRKAPSKCTS